MLMVLLTFGEYDIIKQSCNTHKILNFILFFSLIMTLLIYTSNNIYGINSLNYLNKLVSLF